MQVCYICIHVPWWFAAPINTLSSLGISSSAISPLAPHPLTGPSVWCSPSCVYVFSLFNSHLNYAVFGFLFLCQFAENDGFQLHPRPCKGHELILFYGCIAFYGVYVPHFLYSVYHWWAFGLVSSLCYCQQYHNKHRCTCVFIIEWFIILWVYTQ